MERTGHYYDVIAYKGYSGLCITHNERVQDVVADIDDIVKRAKESGWNNNEQWIIVSVEWGRTWDDDNAFVSSWERRQAVALYDNGVVTDL